MRAIRVSVAAYIFFYQAKFYPEHYPRSFIIYRNLTKKKRYIVRNCIAINSGNFRIQADAFCFSRAGSRCVGRTGHNKKTTGNTTVAEKKKTGVVYTSLTTNEPGPRLSKILIRPMINCGAPRRGGFL